MGVMMIHKSKTLHTMKYRLALDLGTTSIGWAILRLNNEAPPSPTAIIKAGVRIFNNGRDAKTEASLAVTRREARGMRRRRDRLLKRHVFNATLVHGQDRCQIKSFLISKAFYGLVRGFL